MKKTKITLATLSIITIAIVSAFLLNSTGLVRASGVCVETATRKCLPQPAIVNNLIRLIQGQDFNAGIRIGPSDPSSPSGSSTQPIPKYTGINTPWIINPNGPFEITDDSITHGFLDLRMGTTNEKPNGPIPTFEITDDPNWPNNEGTDWDSWSLEGGPPSTGGDFVINFTGTSTDIITYQISDFIFSKSGSFPSNWIKRLEVWQGSESGPVKKIATAIPSDGNLLAAHVDSSPLFTISTSGTVNYPFTLRVYLKWKSELATPPIKEPMDLKFKLETILTKNSSGTSYTPAKTNGLPLEMRPIFLVGLNDLIVESTNITTTSAVSGLTATDQPMSFSAVTKDIGGGTLNYRPSVSSKLCINKNNDASECDIPLFSTHTGIRIPSNGTTTVNFANAWTPGIADIGMHSYSICDDMGSGGSRVYEANENNNCAKGIFSVVRPLVDTHLSPNNPAGGTARRRTQQDPRENRVLKLWLTAGQSSDVGMSNIKIKRSGSGASSLGIIYVRDSTNGTYNLLGGSSIYVNDKVTVTFNGSPFIIRAGKTVELSIQVSVLENATPGTFSLSVESNNDVGIYTSTGTSVGSFPIYGNPFTIP